MSLDTTFHVKVLRFTCEQLDQYLLSQEQQQQLFEFMSHWAITKTLSSLFLVGSGREGLNTFGALSTVMKTKEEHELLANNIATAASGELEKAIADFVRYITKQN